MFDQTTIDEKFETFSLLADREEYYVQILESKPEQDEKRRVDFFLMEVRKSMDTITKELSDMGYQPLKVWAWYDGKEVEW